jgi:hypothetical protein
VSASFIDWLVRPDKLIANIFGILTTSSDLESLVVGMFRLVHRDLTGLGHHNLYKCLYTPFGKNGIDMGRDKLYNVLARHKILIGREKRQVLALLITIMLT